MRKLLLGITVASVLGAASPAAADTFASGSLIIPMDTTYQDQGTLRAFGLLYDLLSKGVPVRWVIRSGKAQGGVDFTATGTDLQTNAAIVAHGYRGGPFVIDSLDAAAATPFIQAYQAANPNVKVHKTTQAFTADVSRYLVAAPKTAMHADGNEGIARSYMQAAGIPDSLGDTTWPAASPDMLTPAEVAGATTASHKDGQLFDAQGNANYCQFMSMHWGVNQALGSPETVAEVREYLKQNTHFFAECQAVNAFENLIPHGFYVTTGGFSFANQPNTYDFLNSDQPFAQMDGPFKSVGGSEPAFTLAAGSAYKASGIVMIKAQGSAPGVEDVWMTGFLDGACPPTQEVCNGLGKVSYLGGHQYPVKLPISNNPSTNGTRLFLNSLFEAPCITSTGSPKVSLSKSAPASTVSDTVKFDLTYSNTGPTVAYAVTLEDALPPGTTFVSCTGGCTVAAGIVKWTLGNLGSGQSNTVSFTVKLGVYGYYFNTATLKYKIGVTPASKTSNTTSTVYDKDSDGDLVPDAVDICPQNYNPAQSLQTDVLSCGACGTVCTVQNGTPECVAGKCGIAGCNSGYSDCNGLYSDGCEYAIAGFQSDPNNCGSCGNKCSYANAQALCSSGSCSMGTCNAGYSNCNGLTADGCEYVNTGFQTDAANCGGCGNQCAAGFVCSGGSCVLNTCPSGYSDCNGLSADGCEYANTGFQTDLNNCGGCGKKCAPQNASGQCQAGACVVVTCNSGYSDCNGLASDGCEVDNTSFQSDPKHCGGCNKLCAPANATGQCTSGACTVGACNAGHSDCNGAAADGCEYADSGFQTDPSNCGGCGKSCAVPNATGSCASGACGAFTCLAGWVDVDKNPLNGCEYSCTKSANADTTCDGKDDDCNGAIDDGYAPTTCGTGACLAASTCTGGQATCTPGAPSSEGPSTDATCADAVDNDCDGLADAADSDCAPSDAGTDADAEAGVGGSAGTDGGSTGGTGGTGGSGGATDSGSGGAAGGSADAGGDADASSGGSAGAASGGAAGSGSAAGAGGAGTGGSAGASTGGSAGASTGGAAGSATGGGGSGAGGTGGKGSGGASDAGPKGSDTSGDEGGCGCRTAGSSGGSLAPVLGALAALCLSRRRRRSRHPSSGR